jgi:hypothetical protein
MKVAAFSAAVLSAVALAACSGASTQIVDTPPPGGSATSSGSGGSGSGSGGSTGSGSGSGGSQGSGSGSGGFDAGVAPTQCPASGTQQTSGSGDSMADAKPFDKVACGTLAAGESYFWTFTLPAATSTFGISFTGGLKIALTLNGTTVDVVPGASLPFKTKEPYYLQVTPGGSAPESYVLVVTEK